MGLNRLLAGHNLRTHFFQGKSVTTRYMQIGSDWLYNDMGPALVLNDLEVWRVHFKAIFLYLRISDAPPRRDATESSERGLAAVRDPSLFPYFLALAR